MNDILERIEREAGVPGLTSILAERLSPTDLQSLLLEVYRRKSRRRQPADVLSDYEANRFVRPSRVSPPRLLEWERVAFSNLPPGFQPVAFSPVCPLGTHSVIAPVDQNWAVSTIRNTEVVSDLTNVLALECTLQRRQLLHRDPKSAEPVHRAASQRMLRPQRYEDPALLPHFSLFALCSAGRDRGSWEFELSTLGLYARFYIRSLLTFLGADTRLRFSATGLRPEMSPSIFEAQLFSKIQAEFQAVECLVDDKRASGWGYYQDVCFHIHAMDPAGQWIELADGGSVDWTQKLLNSSKERLIISGIGSERVCAGLG